MFLKILIFTFVSLNTFSAETCAFDLKRAFESELIAASPLIKNSDHFEDVTQELLSKGLLRKSDMNDVITAKSEIKSIEDSVRKTILQEKNPTGIRSGRQFQKEVQKELEKRLSIHSDYGEWLKQGQESRVELLQQMNMNQAAGKVIDFSSVSSFNSSLRRARSLRNLKIYDAESLLESGDFPETIYRYDNNFLGKTNKKGLPKARIVTRPNGRRELSPVKIDGEGGVANHVAADTAENRSNTPFISFSANQESVERFGNNRATVNVRSLLEGVVSGKVRGIDLVTSDQLRSGAQKRLHRTLEEVSITPAQIFASLDEIKGIATQSNGNLTQGQSQKIQNIITGLARQAKGVTHQERQALTERIRLDVTYLRHTITNDEVLIRGVVPEEYIELPRRLR